MAWTAKSAKAYQLFRGGLNKLSVWAQHLSGACCEPGVTIDYDRLNRTINPENANIHTSPYGTRDNWRFSEEADSERKRIVDWINTQGVGAQLELVVLPAHTFLTHLTLKVLAEEAGFTFDLKTRNGTVLPDTQLIKVSETDSADGCSSVGRVQAAGAWTGLGALSGATRVYTYGAAGDGGNFVLDSDVVILEVTGLPAGGLKGFFDIQLDATYVAPGRSEALI